jgi:hypothetical protein
MATTSWATVLSATGTISIISYVTVSFEIISAIVVPRVMMAGVTIAVI